MSARTRILLLLAGVIVASLASSASILAELTGSGQQLELASEALSSLRGSAAAEVGAALEQAQAAESRALALTAVLGVVTVALAATVFGFCLRLLAHASSLHGLIPICFTCKKIRDDQGYWTEVEAYVEAHSEAAFTHGLCNECKRQMQAELGKLPDNPFDPGPPSVTLGALQGMRD